MKKRYIILLLPFIIYTYNKLNNMFDPWQDVKVFQGYETPTSITFSKNIGFITAYGRYLDDSNLSYWQVLNNRDLYVYKTTDYGKSWKKIAVASKGTYIGPLSFDAKSKKIFVNIKKNIDKRNSATSIWQSLDDGESWKPTSLNDYKFSKITPIDKQITWKVKELIESRTIHFDEKKDRFYMIGRSKDDENQTLLISISQEGKHNIIKRFSNLLVDKLVVNGDTMVIAGSDTQNFGLLGSRKLLYISKNGGITWSEDSYYPTFSRNPFFFDKKKNILWVYGAWGRFFKRKI